MYLLYYNIPWAPTQSLDVLFSTSASLSSFFATWQEHALDELHSLMSCNLNIHLSNIGTLNVIEVGDWPVFGIVRIVGRFCVYAEYFRQASFIGIERQITVVKKMRGSFTKIWFHGVT